MLDELTTSNLGELTFRMGLDSIKHERATKITNDIMQDILRTQRVLNKEVLATYRQKFISGVRAQNEGPSVSFPKRMTKISYRGLPSMC